MIRKVDGEQVVHPGKYRQLSVGFSNQDVDRVRPSSSQVEEGYGPPASWLMSETTYRTGTATREAPS